ncbi:hypothetical protein ACFP65_06680 [Marinilactibacillus sp. GCM10026970]|uniref:hypothetical protein n=1 Tax=Marinilactibacillus sp. GCM10026970 TaxID=3252642 RepID=UPI00360E1617
MYAQFILEWKRFSRNLKNQLLFLLFFFGALYYGLFVAPDYTPVETFADEEAITQRIEEQRYLIDTYGTDRPRTLASAQNIIEVSQTQLNALEEQDWPTYLSQTMNVQSQIRLARYGQSIDPNYFSFGERYPQEEERFWVGYKNSRYKGYINMKSKHITPAVIEERTVLQTIQRLLVGELPFILLGLVVLFSVDSITKNKGHFTIVNAIPLSFVKVLWVKTVVVLMGVTVTIIAATLALVLTIMPRYGMGALSIPVPMYGFNLDGGFFVLYPMGIWIGQALTLFILCALLFNRGITLLSLMFKQEMLNLVLGISVIFSETLYYSRGIGYFSSIGLLPSTFFSIGSVLIGYHNHLYNALDLTFLSGVLSLSATWLVIELLIFVLTRFRYFRIT